LAGFQLLDDAAQVGFAAERCFLFLEALCDPLGSGGGFIGDPLQLADEILRTVAREYNWPDFQPTEHNVIPLDPKTLDAYLGVYQLANAAITITREGDRLFEQLGNQPKFPIFPEADGKFFLKAVDAGLAFDVGAQGKATQLTLHQNGLDQTARRLDDQEGRRYHHWS
jgi:hypothetical protein